MLHWNRVCNKQTAYYSRLSHTSQTLLFFIHHMTMLSSNQTASKHIQSESIKPTLRFSDIICKRLGIFSPNFTYRLYMYIPIYTRLPMFIKLSATLTKLCQIKRDHHNVLKTSTIDRNAHWVVSHLIWHNFVIAGDNWIKICSLMYIGTCNV